MMGKSHALSGAVGWLAGCATFTQLVHAPSPTAVWAGAAVSAGFALLPDLDHPGSTVSRALGPATRAASWVTSRASSVIRGKSCRHCAGKAGGGHRGLTHTAAGAAGVGCVVTGLHVWLGGRAALVVVGFAVWLLAHAAMSSKWRAKVGDVVLPGRFRVRGKTAHRFTAAVGSALLGVLAMASVHDHRSWWWIGIPAAWGCLAHSLGDALTYSAVPLCWPARIGVCRWTPVGTPRWMRFRTGSRTETAVVVLMLSAGIAAIAIMGSGS